MAAAKCSHSLEANILLWLISPMPVPLNCCYRRGALDRCSESRSLKPLHTVQPTYIPISWFQEKGLSPCNRWSAPSLRDQINIAAPSSAGWKSTMLGPITAGPNQHTGPFLCRPIINYGRPDACRPKINILAPSSAGRKSTMACPLTGHGNDKIHH